MAKDIISVEVNGASHSFPVGATVSTMIDALNMAEQRLAIEINREIVPRSQHPEHVLQAGDQIEIVRAIGGGQR